MPAAKGESMSVGSVVNSAAGVTLSRIGSILTPVLFTLVVTLGGLYFNSVIDGLRRDSLTLDIRVSAVEAELPAFSTRIAVQESSTQLGRADRLAAQAEVAGAINEIHQQLALQSNTLAGMASTLDFLKQQTQQSSIFLPNRARVGDLGDVPK